MLDPLGMVAGPRQPPSPQPSPSREREQERTRLGARGTVCRGLLRETEKEGLGVAVGSCQNRPRGRRFVDSPTRLSATRREARQAPLWKLKRRVDREGLLDPLNGCGPRQPPSPQPSPSREREKEGICVTSGFCRNCPRGRRFVASPSRSEESGKASEVFWLATGVGVAVRRALSRCWVGRRCPGGWGRRRRASVRRGRGFGRW